MEVKKKKKRKSQSQLQEAGEVLEKITWAFCQEAKAF